VSGTCQDIIEAIPMAIRDDIHKGKGEDIVKLPTKADDILDCFTAHTRIRTEHGERYICDIKAGERVWTRKGLKKVTASWMSRVGAPVVKLSFSRGESPILCTPAHRFWTQRGWIPAHSLRYDDQLVLWHSLFSKDENTRLFPAATTERQTDSFTAKCGSFITALSCLSITSTIGIMPRWTRLIRMIWSVAAGDSAVRLAGYETAGFADVYDLEVEDAHEFFANGILVHNCIRYGCKSALRAKVTPFPVVAAEKRQEMQQLGLSMTEIAIQLKKLQAGNKERHIRKGSFR
jgi:hypothetical protein